MKKRNTILAVLAIVAILVCAYVMQDEGDTTQNPAQTQSPTATVEAKGLWKDADYLKDTELGNGKKTLYVEVSAEGQAIEFTIHTDKQTVGEALTEHKLIAGEQGPYGLYVKKVNSMEADYDKNGTYWAFNKDGEAMLTGIDSAQFSHGDHFELVCTK